MQGLRARDATVLPAIDTSVRAARTFVRSTLERWQLDDLVEDATLLVSELATNAVVHAGTDFDVVVDRTGDTVEISVLDHYAERALPTEPPRADADAEGGRGLFLVRGVAGHWGVDYGPDGKRVWFRLSSRRPGSGAAGPVAPMHDGELLVAAVTIESNRIVEWHGDAHGMFGWTAAEAAARGLADLVGDDTAADIIATCGRDGRWRGPVAVRHRDGHDVPSFASIVATNTDAGRMRALLVDERLVALLDAPVAAVPARHPTEALSDDALAARLSLDDFLVRLLGRVQERLAADAAYVVLLDEDGSLEVRSTVGAGAPRRVVLPVEEGAAGRLDLLTLPVLVEDTEEHAGIPFPLEDGMRSVLSCPVTAHGRVVGALAVASRRAAAFVHEQALELQDFADRSALALDSVRLVEHERRRRGLLSFLAEASDLLAGTLDPDMTVAMLGQVVVPRLGDWCVVEFTEGAKPFVWHANEACIDALREFATLVRPTVTTSGLTVANRERPLRTSDIAAVRRAAGAEHRDDVAALALSSRVSVPLTARNRELGVLVIGRGAQHPFRTDEVGLVEDLARRAALAIDNARLFADRAAVAATLQASLLPAELPRVAGLDSGVRYAAAGEGLEVGGDFYDLLAVEGGLRFAVGDVCGKGAGAAAVTGIARQTLRLLGRMGRPLPDALEHLNAAILGEGERARFITLLYGELRPRPDGGADLELCCAGHPAPLLVRDGEVRSLGVPQPLLGVLPEATFVTERHPLDRGDLLVCFTDGVTERRRGAEMLGEEGLAETLRGIGSTSAQLVADRIEQAVVNFATEPPRDDVAVLVLRVGG